MNKKMNLIKLHLITGETIETVEEVISHERSDIISQCTSQQKLDTNFKYYLSINLISVQYGASFATFLSG